MSEVIRVVDLSEWTGPVPVENARRMREEWNVEGVILQAWGSGHIPGRRNEYFHQAVTAFRAAGITNIDPYVWPPSEWRLALNWIGDYRRFMSGALYLDVEAGAGVTDDIISGVRAAGWEPRIYASPSSWSAIMGNTTRYAHLKLWLARYLLRFQRPDGYYRPGFNVVFPQEALGVAAVGGWGIEDLVGWQTTGTSPNFCGESVDCSVFHLSAFQQEEEDDMASTFDSIMIGLDGKPRLFQVLKADLTWGEPGPLTYRAYTLLSSLGLVRDRAQEARDARLAALKTLVEGVQSGGAAALAELDKRLDTVENVAHEREAEVPNAAWLGALSSHASDPDAHHE